MTTKKYNHNWQQLSSYEHHSQNIIPHIPQGGSDTDFSSSFFLPVETPIEKPLTGLERFIRKYGVNWQDKQNNERR